MPLSPAANHRLRSLRFCGVMRGMMGDEGFRELFTHDLVQRRYIPGETGPLARCDYDLTPRGHEFAERIANPQFSRHQRSPGYDFTDGRTHF